jgi:hypothetical protein
MRRTPIAVVAMLVILSACSREAGGPSDISAALVTPASTPAAEPSPTQTPAPSPNTLGPLPSDPMLRHTVELRRAMGLRSDLEWIAAVAADPRATTYLLEIPLLPEEEANVVAASIDADTVGAVVKDYAAAHVDEFGGLYIDRETGAGVVTLWTDHLAGHEAAIRARLAPASRVSFRSVRFSERYLRSVQRDIEADLEWMSAIPAQWQMVSDDVIHNTVLLSVSSANPRAVALIEEYFDLGEALTVISDGTGVALIEWGEITGRVRTAAGDVPPAAPYYLRWYSADTRRCGVGDVAYGIDDKGSFTLPCQAGAWTIEVTVPSGDDWRPIGSGTVVVAPNATATLEITLEEAP